MPQTRSKPSPSPKRTGKRSSPRRPRRTALRTSSKLASLSQRRAHFERVVNHHISHHKSASPTELWSLDESVVGEDPVSVEPADVKRVLANIDSAPHVLCSILLRLRKVASISSSDAGSNDGEDSSSDDLGVILNKGDARISDEGEVIELEDVKRLAQVLVNDDFIENDSDEVLLFTACILAEILRITAPKPPLSDSKLKALCSLFVDQLSVIAVQHDHLRSFRFTLLEQLASVKTFVLFADEDHVATDIFACFYAAIRPHQAEKYKEHLGFILITLLEEVEEINQPLLDALLAPLTRPSVTNSDTSDPALKSFSSYSASACALAEFVVKGSKNLLQVPICNFFNAALHRLSKGRVLPENPTRPVKRRKIARVLADDDPDFASDDKVSSELMDDIEDLIIEVNRIAPEILVYVIPSLEDRLTASEPVVRRNIAHLLGKLFMSSPDAVSAYPPLFTEYLQRARDVEPALRAQVCSTLGSLIVSTPRQRELLNKRLQDRVMDQSELVRETVAVSVGRTQSFASVDLITTLSTRLRDRRPSVRYETFRQLNSLYRAQLKLIPRPVDKLDPIAARETDDEMKDDPSEESSEQESSTPNATESLALDSEGKKSFEVPEWSAVYPNILVQSFKKLEQIEDRKLLNEIELSIFEQFFSWEAADANDDNVRVKKFAAFIGNLDPQAFVHFSGLVSRRARIATALRRICLLRLAARRSEKSNSDAISPMKSTASEPGTPVKQIKRTFSRLSQSPATRKGLTENLSSHQLIGDLQVACNTLSILLGRRKFRNEDSSALCWKMCNFADLRFYEQLNTALNPSVSCDVAVAASQDAVSRLSSKSVLGEYLASVVLPSARCLLFSTRHAEAAYHIVSNYCTYAKTHNADIPREESLLKGSTETSFAKENDILCGVLRYIELTSFCLPKVFKDLLHIPMGLVRQSSHKELNVIQVLLCGLKVMSRVDCAHIDPAERTRILQQLRTIMIAPVDADPKISSLLAKWATRAFIRFCKESKASDEIWETTLSMLWRCLELYSADALHLVCAVSALAQVAKHATEAFKPIAVKSFDHARHMLEGTFNESLCKPFNNACDFENHQEDPYLFRHIWNSSFPPSCSTCKYSGVDKISNLYVACLAELASRAMKLLIYSLHAIDVDDLEVSYAIRLLNDVAEERRGDIFLLRRKKNEEGEELEPDSDSGQNPSVVSACNVIRLAASSGILNIGRSKRFYRHVTPKYFKFVVLRAQDPYAEVRISFARNLHRYVHSKGLPFRWITALALMAVDPEKENREEVKGLLTNALQKRRYQIKHKMQKSSTVLRNLLPESTISVLIWLLANHPDVPVEGDAFMEIADVCMDFLLERLLGSNEYAAVIHEYLDALALARDRTEDENEYDSTTQVLRNLARSCTLILQRKQAGRKWNLLKHPGSVELPADLFRKEPANVENSDKMDPSPLDVAKMYDDDVQSPKAENKPADRNRSNEPENAIRSPMSAHDVTSTPSSLHHPRVSNNTEDQVPDSPRLSKPVKRRTRSNASEIQTAESGSTKTKRRRSSRRHDVSPKQVEQVLKVQTKPSREQTDGERPSTVSTQLETETPSDRIDSEKRVPVLRRSARNRKP